MNLKNDLSEMDKGTMKLKNLSENVIEIMNVTGFSSIMTIE